MIPAYQKISSREFKTFLKKGKKKHSSFFSAVFVVKNGDDNTEISKYAVIISKKLVKTAIVRGRNKRIVYRIIKEVYPQFNNIKYGFIFIKKDISDIHYNEIKKDILHLFNK